MPQVWMVRTVLLALSALALSAVPAESTICMPPTVVKDSPYQYIKSLTDALSYAKEALDRTTSLQPRQGGEVDLFVALKLAKTDYDCARSQVAPYTASTNQAIKTSADGTAFTFEQLAQLSDRTVAEYREVLNARSEGKQLKQGTLAERQAELAVAYDETWKMLIPSVTAGTYAVVEQNPKTGLMSGLALTRPQRDEILRKLRTTFGDNVTRGPQAGQSSLTAAAGILYEVIGNQKRQLRGQ